MELAAMRAVPFLRNLPESALEGLGSRLRAVECEAGAELFHAGEPGDTMYVVESGELEALLALELSRELSRRLVATSLRVAPAPAVQCTGVHGDPVALARVLDAAEPGRIALAVLPGATVGVLRVLREIGIEIDALAGTSGGAVVGAGYACGLGEEELVARLRELARSLQLRHGDFNLLPRSALLKGARLRHLFDFGRIGEFIAEGVGAARAGAGDAFARLAS